MVVLPASMVEEIRVLPSSIANPTVAHAHNLLGAYTRMDLILRSNLHFRMIQSKLTPSLGSLTGPMEEEVRFAVASHLPECGDWVAIKPYHMMLELVAHVSARVFVGLPLCRSREWLEISTQFTENSKPESLLPALLTIDSLRERVLHALVPGLVSSSSGAPPAIDVGQ